MLVNVHLKNSSCISTAWQSIAFCHQIFKEIIFTIMHWTETFFQGDLQECYLNGSLYNLDLVFNAFLTVSAFRTQWNEVFVNKVDKSEKATLSLCGVDYENESFWKLWHFCHVTELFWLLSSWIVLMSVHKYFRLHFFKGDGMFTRGCCSGMWGHLLFSFQLYSLMFYTAM